VVEFLITVNKKTNGVKMAIYMHLHYGDMIGFWSIYFMPQ
jgi:hypothetical protein